MLFNQRLLTGAIGFTLLILFGCQKTQSESQPVRSVRTMVIQPQEVLLAREFSGDIQARSQAHLSFRVPGKILKRHIDLGDGFKAGQILVQLDSADLSLNEQSAKAALAAVQVQTSQALADYNRFKELHVQGFISAAQLEQYDSALKAAKAGLAQAKANQLLQANQASYTKILADRPGVVTAVAVEAGQVVGAGLPVLTVAYDGPRDVVFSVPDNLGATMRSMIDKESALSVKVWGQDQSWAAKVREVAASADAATRTLQVKSTLENIDSGDLHLGQIVTVAFNEASRNGQGIWLPLHAMIECGGKSCVWLVNQSNMTVIQKSVVTADISDNQILVTTGLEPGQEVVTAGVHVLSAGQKIKRLKEASAANKPHDSMVSGLTH